MYVNDTIAAIATGNENCAISIIRISGDRAIQIIEPLVRKKLKKYQVNYCVLKHGGRKLDEAIVLYMPAPNSYSGEDVVEIHCHGGRENTRDILEKIVNQGARLAKKGEFTRRAYLNNKITLNKAELINKLIHVQGTLQLEGIRKSLDQGLNKLFDQEEEELEKLIDENTINTNKIESLFKKTKEVLVNNENEQYSIKRIVIIGEPNVGKSTIFNGLLGFERSIVDLEPGTTRDIVSEKISKNTLIVDTAGIRETSNRVEKKGIEKVKELLDQGDLIIWVFEKGNSQNLDQLKKIKQSLKNKKTIAVINKNDLKKNSCLELEDLFTKKIFMSALSEKDLQKLKQRILFEIQKQTNYFAISSYQKIIIIDLIKKIEQFKKSFDQDIPIVYLVEELKEIKNQLRQLTGKEELSSKYMSENRIGKLFDSYCVGK